jgi:uncharacterized protein
MWQDLVTAVALLLVLEGIVPFLNPDGLRRALQMLTQMSDSALRFAGLTSMVIGCLLLYVIR